MGTACKHSGARGKTWEWIILFLDPVEEHRNVQTQTNTHTMKNVPHCQRLVLLSMEHWQLLRFISLSYIWRQRCYRVHDMRSKVSLVAEFNPTQLKLFTLVLFSPALVCKEWNIVDSMFLVTHGHRKSWRRRRWLDTTTAMNINGLTQLKQQVISEEGKQRGNRKQKKILQNMSRKTLNLSKIPKYYKRTEMWTVSQQWMTFSSTSMRWWLVVPDSGGCNSSRGPHGGALRLTVSVQVFPLETFLSDKCLHAEKVSGRHTCWQEVLTGGVWFSGGSMGIMILLRSSVWPDA